MNGNVVLTFYRENARVGAGFTPARLREGVKPSPTFLCALGVFMRGGDM